MSIFGADRSRKAFLEDLSGLVGTPAFSDTDTTMDPPSGVSFSDVVYPTPDNTKKLLFSTAETPPVNSPTPGGEPAPADAELTQTALQICEPGGLSRSEFMELSHTVNTLRLSERVNFVDFHLSEGDLRVDKVIVLPDSAVVVMLRRGRFPFLPKVGGRLKVSTPQMDAQDLVMLAGPLTLPGFPFDLILLAYYNEVQDEQ